MPKPIPGQPYTIVKGDTLSRIAQQSYGIARKWREIWAANETVLRSGDPNLIFPGEVINIPTDAPIEKIKEDQKPELTGKDPNEFTLIIGGEELPVTSAKVTLTADTAANGWTATRAFDSKDPFTREFLSPYKYPKAEVYLGGKKVDTGILFRPVTKGSPSGDTIDLHGFTQTANLIDSVVKSPFQENNVTLKQRVESMLEGRSIPFIFEASDTAKFRRVKAGKTEKIFVHLDKLSKQRAALISCTNLGELLIYDPATDGSIGTIEEGTGQVESFSGDWDGRARFNSYLAYGKGASKNKKAVSKDPVVPVSRMTAFEANDTTAGDIQAAADYFRNKQIADSLTLSLPVGSWYGPDEKLWTPNTLVTVKSSTLFLDDGFTFLIRAVEFDFDSTRTTATIHVLPPTVYTKGELVDPWAAVT